MKRSLILIIALSLCIPAGLAAQNVDSFALKNFKPKGINNNGNRLEISAVVTTNQETLLGVSEFIHNVSGRQTIYAYEIRNNTAPQRASELFSTDGTIFKVDAVWAGNHGLVFFATSTSESYSNNLITVQIYAMKVDSRGRPLNDPILLTVFNGPSHSWFSFSELRASTGNSEVLVVVSGNFQRNHDATRFTGFFSYDGLLIRTDLDGNFLRQKRLRTPGGARLRVVKIHDIRFDGQTWFLPVSLTVYEKYYVESVDRFYTREKENFLFLLHTDEGRNPVGRKQLIKERAMADKSFQAYWHVAWLPTTSASAIDGSMGLLVTHRSPASPDVYRKTDFYDYEFLLQYVDFRGRRQGDPHPLELTNWDRNYQWEEGDRFNNATNDLSNLVAINDEFYLFQSLSIAYFEKENLNRKRAEYEQRLWKLQEDGTLTLLAVNNQAQGAFISRAAKLLYHNGRLMMFFRFSGYLNDTFLIYGKSAFVRP